MTKAKAEDNKIIIEGRHLTPEDITSNVVAAYLTLDIGGKWSKGVYAVLGEDGSIVQRELVLPSLFGFATTEVQRDYIHRTFDADDIKVAAWDSSIHYVNGEAIFNPAAERALQTIGPKEFALLAQGEENALAEKAFLLTLQNFTADVIQATTYGAVAFPHSFGGKASEWKRQLHEGFAEVMSDRQTNLPILDEDSVQPETYFGARAAIAELQKTEPAQSIIRIDGGYLTVEALAHADGGDPITEPQKTTEYDGREGMKANYASGKWQNADIRRQLAKKGENPTTSEIEGWKLAGTLEGDGAAAYESTKGRVVRSIGTLSTDVLKEARGLGDFPTANIYVSLGGGSMQDPDIKKAVEAYVGSQGIAKVVSDSEMKLDVRMVNARSAAEMLMAGYK